MVPSPNNKIFLAGIQIKKLICLQLAMKTYKGKGI